MVLERPEICSKVPVQVGSDPALVRSFSDPIFVRGIASISDFDESEILFDLFHRFPILANERGFWKTIIEEAYLVGKTVYHTVDEMNRYDIDRFLPPLLATYAPLQILRDRDLILRACARGACGILSVIPHDLQHDREFIEKSAEFPTGIHSISKAAQRMYPDLAARAIFKGEMNCRQDLGLVAPELWTNLKIVAAWFRKPEAHFHAHFPPEVMDNQEFALVVAQQAAFSILQTPPLWSCEATSLS